MIRLMSALKLILCFFHDIYLLFVIYMPGETGVRIRRRYYSKRLKRCGTNLVVHPGVHLGGLGCMEFGDNVMIRENAIIQTGWPPVADERRCVRYVERPTPVDRGVVIIGNNSRIAHGVVILGYGGVVIGEKCGIGPGSILLSESFHHKGDDPSLIYKYSQGADKEEQCIIQGCVELSNGAGVASNVVILPGAKVGQDSWVLPNSVIRVGATIPALVIAKGDPAVVVQKRTCALASHVD